MTMSALMPHTIVTRNPAGDGYRTGSHELTSRAAFTLIELLVVVSIIALLISVLLPSLKRARHQAKSVLCLANIKAIAAGSLTYAGEDPHEQSIPVHPLFDRGGDPGAYDWGGKSGRGDTVDAMDSPFSTPQGRGPATRPLNHVLFKERFTDYQDTPGINQFNWENDQSLDLAIHRCPSDRGYTGHHYATWENSRLSSYDHYGTSYAHSTLLYTLQTWGPDTVSLSPYYRPLSRIPVPGETVYYLENCGRFAWHVRFGIDDEPDRYACHRWAGIWALPVQPAHVDGWHGRAYDFATAFVDGHAAMVEMNGRVVPPPGWTSWRASTRQGSAGWVGWHSSNIGGGGFFAYRSCQWIRGDGWRIDANPGAPGYFDLPDFPTPQAAEIR